MERERRLHRFQNRQSAGAALAKAVDALQLPSPVVLALPRGGVPVAMPIANTLNAPLDLIMVRKIGAPGQPELAAGAVVSGTMPQTVWNEDVLRGFGLGRTDLAKEVDSQLAVITERHRTYLQGRAPIEVDGHDVVLVDDGIATGATAKAAIKGLLQRVPASVTLAVPVAPSGTAVKFRKLVDRFLCLASPEPFFAVGQGYWDFTQTSDAEVITHLREAAERAGTGGRE